MRRLTSERTATERVSRWCRPRATALATWSTRYAAGSRPPFRSSSPARSPSAGRASRPTWSRPRRFGGHARGRAVDGGAHEPALGRHGRVLFASRHARERALQGLHGARGAAHPGVRRRHGEAVRAHRGAGRRARRGGAGRVGKPRAARWTSALEAERARDAEVGLLSNRTPTTPNSPRVCWSSTRRTGFSASRRARWRLSCVVDRRSRGAREALRRARTRTATLRDRRRLRRRRRRGVHGVGTCRCGAPVTRASENLDGDASRAKRELARLESRFADLKRRAHSVDDGADRPEGAHLRHGEGCRRATRRRAWTCTSRSKQRCTPRSARPSRGTSRRAGKGGGGGGGGTCARASSATAEAARARRDSPRSATHAWPTA